MKSIVSYKTKDNIKTVDFERRYNKDGCVLVHGHYSFEYDTQNDLTKIKYPNQRFELSLDSMTINENIDTCRVFYALHQYNNIFNQKLKVCIAKDGREMNSYLDTIKLCHSKMIMYHSTSKEFSDCHVQSLTLPNLAPNVKEYIETYKYDFGYQPPVIELTQRDTLGKFKKISIYSATQSKETSPVFIGYSLSYVNTEIHSSELNEYIDEYYNYEDGDHMSFSKFPNRIEHYKEYGNKTEYYEYQCKSAKSKKLVSFYVLNTEYSYFE